VSAVVTYSPAYTLVPTYECFNQCTYCNFRKEPGQDDWLSLTAARQILAGLPSESVIEILILSGEVHPGSHRRQQWFQHLLNLCQLALAQGFLPHTNAGPLSYEEMQQLKSVNVSMGLMLEQLTPALLNTVHCHAPSKVPAVRLQQLVWAGELQIPFTTGLLLGIGETAEDWQVTLGAIATLHDRYGHIQEVILQPYQPGGHQREVHPACDDRTLVKAVTLAREILPDDITIQIPPNLIHDAQQLIACLWAGARDLGGIGPKDEVNPDYPHHGAHQLATLLQTHGWELRPRLPIYPTYDRKLPTGLRQLVKARRDQLNQSSITEV
jgi:FO synthase subunit 1